MKDSFLPFTNEVYRKIIHTGSCLIALIYFYVDYISFILLIIVSLSITILINYLYNNSRIPFISINQLFSKVLRNYETKQFWGSTYMLIGFFIIALFFPKEAVIPAILITSISDSVAAIVGMKYGKILTFNNKSLEGFAAFTISSYLILFLTVNTLNFFYLYVIAFLAATIEILTPTKFDNMTIPIGVAMLISLGLAI